MWGLLTTMCGHKPASLNVAQSEQQSVDFDRSRRRPVSARARMLDRGDLAGGHGTEGGTDEQTRPRSNCADSGTHNDRRLTVLVSAVGYGTEGGTDNVKLLFAMGLLWCECQNQFLWSTRARLNKMLTVSSGAGSATVSGDVGSHTNSARDM